MTYILFASLSTRRDCQIMPAFGNLLQNLQCILYYYVQSATFQYSVHGNFIVLHYICNAIVCYFILFKGKVAVWVIQTTGPYWSLHVHLQLCQYWNIFKKFCFAWLEILTSNLELPIVWQKFEPTFHIQSPICPTPFSSFLRTTPLLFTFFLTTSPNEIRDKHKNNWGKVISSCLEGYIRKNISCFFCKKHL